MEDYRKIINPLKIKKKFFLECWRNMGPQMRAGLTLNGITAVLPFKVPFCGEIQKAKLLDQNVPISGFIDCFNKNKQ